MNQPYSKTGFHAHGSFIWLAIVTISFSLAEVGLTQEAAPQTKVVTLEEALLIAGEHSRDLKLAEEYGNQVRGIYVEQRAAAFPQLSFTGTTFYLNDKATEAVSQGTTPARTDFNSLELNLTQPLFTWGQVSAAIRAAKLGLATASEQMRLARLTMIRDVSTSFYDTLLAKRMLAIAEQNLAQKQRHADEAHHKFSIGAATNYDVLAADVAVQNARPQVIQAENLVRIARDRLRFLLGLETENLDVSGELHTPEAVLPGFEDTLSAAWNNRPDLAMLRQKIAISEELVKISSAGDKPSLALAASTGWDQYKILDQSADGETWSAGLVLSWSVFDGLRTRGRVAQAKSDMTSLKITEEQVKEAIILEARNASNSAQEAKEITSALSGTVEQAQRLLTMAEQGYALGVMTKLNVDDAMLGLTAAQGSLARAQRDFLVALANLNWVMGKEQSN